MISSLSLKKKLFTIALIPLSAFILSVSVSMWRSIDEFSIIKSQDANMYLMTENISFIKALQKERGSSSRYLAGDLSKSELENIRLESDEALIIFEKIIESSRSYSKYLDLKKDLPSAISSIRNKVDSYQVSIVENMEQYTLIINTLLDINTDTAEAKTAGGIGKRLSSINIITLSQENAGRLRGYVSGILAADHAVGWDILFQVIVDYAGINNNLENPAVLLSNESRTLLNNLRNSAEWSFVNNSVFGIINQADTGNFGIDNNRFWNNSTAVVELIDKIANIELSNTKNMNDRIYSDYSKYFIITALLLLISLIVIAIILKAAIKSISLPISNVGESLDALAKGEGDLTIKIKETGSDELYLLARNFNSFTAALSMLLSEIKNQINILKTSGYRLSESMQQTSTAENQITSTIESLSKMSEKQSLSVEKTSDILGLFFSNVTTMRQMIENQAASVAESSASIEQMMANIQSVTRSAEKTGDIVKVLVDSAEDGKKKISNVAENIRTISVQSEMLQDANKMIASIAAQTNLLSMNAAIEAAHAGAYGRGFAVVADEIRKLAVISSQQSKKISSNLKEIQQVINLTVESSKTAETSFIKMHENVYNVDTLQNEVKNAMMEQNAGSKEIVTALSDINDTTEKIRDFAVEMDSEGASVIEEIKNNYKLTNEVDGAVREIYAGAVEINKAVNEVLKLTAENSATILKVTESIGKIKLRE